MSKKEKVVESLEVDGKKVKEKEGGIYSLFPYEKLNKGNGLFKVGLADSFSHRIESYHTYYPLGFYYKNLLLNPNKHLNEVRKQTNEQFKKKHKGRPSPEQRAALNKTTRHINYLTAEKSLFHDIKELGGQQLRTTTRIKNANETGGESEWFYTNQQTLDRAFAKANKEYGGKLLATHLNDINKNAANNKSGSTYTGEIHYKIV